MFNAPAPVTSITDENGSAGSGQAHARACRWCSPQVAAQAVSILAGDTRFPGTSASQFQDWYSQNSSVIAGKTGTAVDGGTGLEELRRCGSSG